jgi:hypothetical protein
LEIESFFMISHPASVATSAMILVGDPVMRRFALFAVLLLPGLATAQYGPVAYYPNPPGAYFGFWTGPAFGYLPGAYGGQWSNGYSLYGPPVPTYGSIPGYFGGADQRLSNFPDNNALFPPYGYGYGYGWGGRGVVIPLNPPRPEVTMMAGPGICEVHVPAADAELFVNGKKIEGRGLVRKLGTGLPPRSGTTLELEARWTTESTIGSARRWATVRSGEVTVIDFSKPAGG